MSDNIIPFPKKEDKDVDPVIDFLEAISIPCDRCGEILCDGFCNEE